MSKPQEHPGSSEHIIAARGGPPDLSPKTPIIPSGFRLPESGSRKPDDIIEFLEGGSGGSFFAKKFPPDSLFQGKQMDSASLAKMIQEIVLLVPGFLMAVTIHEYAHGYIAYRLGDPTAKMAGRLTFNPISHLDPFGTLALVLTQMIGWAKPVPVDPRYLRNPRQDMLWISLGGPVANLAGALACSLVLHILLMAFRGSPAGPVTTSILGPLAMILYRALIINVGLAVFNLIPVPPLDGFGVLIGMLPRETAYQFGKIEPYGFIILIALIFTGVVNIVLRPVIMFLVSVLSLGLR